MTNADKIRVMPNDELASIINCPYGIDSDLCNLEAELGNGCLECCKKWLEDEEDLINYPDYCVIFYDREKNEVCLHDEIKSRIVERKKVSGSIEADIIMRVWQDNAPDGIICDILSD